MAASYYEFDILMLEPFVELHLINYILIYHLSISDVKTCVAINFLQKPVNCVMYYPFILTRTNMITIHDFNLHLVHH